MYVISIYYIGKLGIVGSITGNTFIIYGYTYLLRAWAGLESRVYLLLLAINYIYCNPFRVEKT